AVRSAIGHPRSRATSRLVPDWGDEHPTASGPAAAQKLVHRQRRYQAFLLSQTPRGGRSAPVGHTLGTPDDRAVLAGPIERQRPRPRSPRAGGRRPAAARWGGPRVV